MPLGKNVKFRFRTITPVEKQRLAFKNKKVVEVTPYRRKNNVWVRGHPKKI